MLNHLDGAHGYRQHYTANTYMTLETQHRSMRWYFVVVIAIVLLSVLWVCFSIGRVLTGQAPWGPRVGGKLPNGTEVYFQARPGGFETDDRLTVAVRNMAPQHYWVDQVHGGFEHVVLKYNGNGNQLWVESDGKVGASIDLATNDFRAENDTQHTWAAYGTGAVLDSGNTSSIFSLLSPW
jgi:hypothetical protein